MVETYYKLLEEIAKLEKDNLGRASSAYKATKFLLRDLAEVIANRSFHLGNPMVDFNSFLSSELMYRMEMIDSERQCKYEITWPPSPYFYHLTAKAVKLHKDLCQEGYYGGKDDPVNYPEIEVGIRKDRSPVLI